MSGKTSLAATTRACTEMIDGRVQGSPQLVSTSHKIDTAIGVLQVDLLIFPQQDILPCRRAKLFPCSRQVELRELRCDLRINGEALGNNRSKHCKPTRARDRVVLQRVCEVSRMLRCSSSHSHLMMALVQGWARAATAHSRPMVDTWKSSRSMASETSKPR